MAGAARADCYHDANNLTACTAQFEAAIGGNAYPLPPPAPPDAGAGMSFVGHLIWWLELPFWAVGQFVGAVLDALLGACLAVLAALLAHHGGAAMGLWRASGQGWQPGDVCAFLLALACFFGTEVLVRVLVFGDWPSTGSMAAGFALLVLGLLLVLLFIAWSCSRWCSYRLSLL